MLKVPNIAERKDIIIKSHLLGHFQVYSTYQRLKEKYFWPKMIQDIERIIGNCDQCKRNQKSIVYNHPANALEITRIFDRVGIDLILGLPETEEGFNGIMVITEYLSKYPLAKPIKSKNAEEIALILFEYICLFGPHKIVLSDQGTEFNNKLIDALLNLSGSERRVTSAYNPRTNGQTERFNQTLIESLRKHCEFNTSKWHLWIPFILFSYRTRINTTTGYTPNEILFGRKVYNFEDFNENTKINFSGSLEERTKEIKNLIENIEDTAKTNIIKKQTKQIDIQDNCHRIKINSLGKDQMVYIKNDGLQPKLAPRFKGPFFIEDSTANGNYRLRDATGELVNESYPLHKLKVIKSLDEIEENVYEIEKILNHKDEDGIRYYLVKWKSLDEETWEKETNFNSTKLINQYLNNKINTTKQKFINNNNIKIIEKDLFSCNEDVSLAHCVSEDFKMGKGIAKKFKEKFGNVNRLINQEKKVGECAILKHEKRHIFYLITKKHYSDKPTYKSVKACLIDMKEKCKNLNIKKLAMPKIGCGLDKLNFSKIVKLLNNIFNHNEIEIIIYDFKDDIPNNININKQKTYNLRKQTQVVSAHVLSMSLIYSLIFMFLITMISGDTHVTGNFNYCNSINNADVINLDAICVDTSRVEDSVLKQSMLDNRPNYDRKYFSITMSPFKAYVELYTMGKMSHTVYGNGTQCKMTKTTITTEESFFSFKYTKTDITSVKLSMEDCLVMEKTKKCRDEVMTCDNNGCIFEAKPNPEHQWMSTREFVYYSCTTTKRVISEPNKKDFLFNSKCKVTDLFCRFHDYVIIWSISIIHECPLYGIQPVAFEVTEKYFISKKERLAFEFKSIETICGMQVYTTTEDIYITFAANNKVNYDRANKDLIDIKTLADLILADEDYYRITDHRENKLVVTQMCNNFVSMLRLFEKIEDKFITTTDYSGRPITLYSNHGNIYKPKCIKVVDILVPSDIKFCYKDLPIKFNLLSSSSAIYENPSFGFLTTDGIIKTFSEKIPCDTSGIRYFKINNI